MILQRLYRASLGSIDAAVMATLLTVSARPKQQRILKKIVLSPKLSLIYNDTFLAETADLAALHFGCFNAQDWLYSGGWRQCS
jgi:hypothetical protein